MLPSGSFAVPTSVTGYEWKLISGPSQFFINNPYSAHTKVDQLTLGTYIFELRITDNNGATDTDTMQLSVKNIPLSKATVYPNPVSSTLNIRIDANTHNNLTLVVIYDVSGKAIYKEQFLRTEFSVVKPIDVSHLIPGTYFVNIEADINRSVGLKFIKQ